MTIAVPLGRVRAVLARRRGEVDADAGSITVLIVFMALSLVLIAGLVFDAGGALTDRQRATDIAEQTARYAADQVEPAPPGVTPLIDPDRARAAASRFLAREGVHGDVRASTTQVTVTVTIKHRTSLLSAVPGLSSLIEKGTSTATPLSGLKTAGTTGGQ